MINAGKDVEIWEPSYTVGRNQCSHYGKQYGVFFKKTKNRVTIRFSNPTPGHISGKD